MTTEAPYEREARRFLDTNVVHCGNERLGVELRLVALLARVAQEAREAALATRCTDEEEVARLNLIARVGNENAWLRQVFDCAIKSGGGDWREILRDGLARVPAPEDARLSRMREALEAAQTALMRVANHGHDHFEHLGDVQRFASDAAFAALEALA